MALVASACGELRVNIISAEGLPYRRDFSDAPEVFCQVSVRGASDPPAAGKIISTTVVDKSVSPTWNHTVALLGLTKCDILDFQLLQKIQFSDVELGIASYFYDGGINDFSGHLSVVDHSSISPPGALLVSVAEATSPCRDVMHVVEVRRVEEVRESQYAMQHREVIETKEIREVKEKIDLGGTTSEQLAQYAERSNVPAVWNNLGVSGGGVVGGRQFNERECYEKALDLDQNNPDTWSNMALVGGGRVGGTNYSPDQCFKRVLELNRADAKAWSSLGVAGGVEMDGCRYNSKDCFEKVLEINPNDAKAWNNLGSCGGGSVRGTPYIPARCFENSIRLNPHNSQAWNNMGNASGGTIHGSVYTSQMCYERAVAEKSDYGYGWHNLGTVGGGTVNGHRYTAADCYVKAIEFAKVQNAATGEIWNNLGAMCTSTVEVRGRHYTKCDCFLQALGLNPHDAIAWFNIAIHGGIVGGDRPREPRQCYGEALSLNPGLHQAWSNLGILGGGTVRGTELDAKDCFARALDHDPKSVYAWNGLGVVGGGLIGGCQYGAKECFERAAENHCGDAAPWFNLGICGGGKVRGRHYTKQECYVKALEYNSKDGDAWNNLGITGGGYIGGRPYSEVECFAQSIECQDNPTAWRNLGICGGGCVRGTHHTSQSCFAESLRRWPDDNMAWGGLAAVGGGTIDGHHIDRKECWIRAIEACPEDAAAWNNLGASGGGNVRGRSYSPPECFQMSLKCDPSNPAAEENLQALKRNSFVGNAQTTRGSNAATSRDVASVRKSTTKAQQENAFTLNIIHAEHIRGPAQFGHCDSYVVVRVDGSSEPIVTTKVCHNTLQPRWDEMFEVHGAPEGSILNFELWDRNECLGSQKISVAHTPLEHYALNMHLDGASSSPLLHVMMGQDKNDSTIRHATRVSKNASTNPNASSFKPFSAKTTLTTNRLAPRSPSMQSPQALVVSLTVVSAGHVDGISSKNPARFYVVCKEAESDSEIFRTDMSDGTMQPQWKQTFDILGLTQEGAELGFELWEHNVNQHDQFIGSGRFMLMVNATFNTTLHLEKDGFRVPAILNLEVNGIGGAVSTRGSQMTGYKTEHTKNTGVSGSPDVISVHASPMTGYKTDQTKYTKLAHVQSYRSQGAQVVSALSR